MRTARSATDSFCLDKRRIGLVRPGDAEVAMGTAKWFNPAKAMALSSRMWAAPTRPSKSLALRKLDIPPRRGSVNYDARWCARARWQPSLTRHAFRLN